MLADPFGNRTIPVRRRPRLPRRFPRCSRVIYLVEVCDPCEDAQFSYSVNGEQLSDFITPHYYDPGGATGVQYSFRGNIKAPHTVLENGYVSFGNPVTNQWYQIIVDEWPAGSPGSGKLNRNGRSLRETVDDLVRHTEGGSLPYQETAGCPGRAGGRRHRRIERSAGQVLARSRRSCEAALRQARRRFLPRIRRRVSDWTGVDVRPTELLDRAASRPRRSELKSGIV